MYQRARTDPFGKSSGQPEPVFAHHETTWGPVSQFGYKDFIPLFEAEKWNPEAWADLFVQSGARYVVPVAEHHDGFAMYASSVTRWNAKNMGPHRDVVGELFAALRQRGVKTGVSSHYAFNRSYYTCEPGFDTCDPKLSDLYGDKTTLSDTASPEFLDRWWRRTVEIADKYQPDVFWFDFGINYPEFQPYLQRFAAHYYNRGIEWNKGVVLQYKTIHKGSFPEGTAVLDIERGKLAGIREMVWQTDTSISRKSWGYIEGDDFKSADSLIDDLVDIVSKNGCLLLNVGPKADGSIPEEAQKILREIGAWLKVNGEAIYGTRPWKVYGEGPTREQEGHMGERRARPEFQPSDIRFTVKGKALFAIALAKPSGVLLVTALRAGQGRVKSVRLLGASGSLRFTQTAAALEVPLPVDPAGSSAWAFRIELE
jgi:alpha-L-fucosidase